MKTVSEILASGGKARMVSANRRMHGVDQHTALSMANVTLLSDAIDSMESVEDVKEVLHFILENPQCLGS